MHFEHTQLKIMFRDKVIIISSEDFMYLRRFRDIRIKTGEYLKNKDITCDFYAINKIKLVQCGDICPTEMALMHSGFTNHSINPSGPFDKFTIALNRQFGPNWAMYDEWNE